MNCEDHDSLYWTFTQVIRFHYYRTHTLLEQIGVYPGQPPLLFALNEKDGQSQRELAGKLHIKPSTITVMLKRMEKAELVMRCADKNDRRISRVHLTEKGKEFLGEINGALKTIEKETFNGFTVEEKMLLRRLFMQMRDNLANGCEHDLD